MSLAISEDRWEKVPRLGGVPFASFPERGASVDGAVVHYDEHAGGRLFDNAGECGLLVLSTAVEGPVKVTLDKGSLRDAVRDAMRRAERRGLVRPGMRVTYAEDRPSVHGRPYKVFSTEICELTESEWAAAQAAAEDEPF